MFAKAPYNFVPLNTKVVLPHWGKHINHDRPFKDAQSGSFKVRIKAASAIFVRDGQKTRKEATTEVDLFTKFKDHYFIPGSSTKGMLRNVLEVMSFAKMNKVNNHRYAVRDLARSAKEIYLDNFKPNEINAGWLQKRTSDGAYEITDCQKPGRISHRFLDRFFQTGFSDFFQPGGGFKNNNDQHKSARFKYNKFGTSKSLTYNFVDAGNSAGRPLFDIDPNGTEKGTLVFTGQPGPRKQQNNGKWTGKQLEFIFFQSTGNKLPVSEEVMDNFLFAYYEKERENWSEDWAYWRDELRAGKPIPIFFRKSPDGTTVANFGLSYLYKLPYKNSVKETIQSNQENGKDLSQAIDLAEAIFGYTFETKDSVAMESLKGRVHIGHAKGIEATCQEDPKVTAILSTPKASYYPNYIRQNLDSKGRIKGKYSTFMDRKPMIAGWKRYPIHQQDGRSNLAARDREAYKNVSTSFVPLKKGAEFEFTVRYHNLKKIELGALISAITFHQTADTFHSLGMAKPLGFGKVKLEITDISAELRDECLQAYEAYMNVELVGLPHKWHESPQIKNLMSMVSEQPQFSDRNLSYMKMGMQRGENHFVEAKKAFEGLNEYTKQKGVVEIPVQTLVAEAGIQQMEILIEEEKVSYQKKKTASEQVEIILAKKRMIFDQLFAKKKEALIEKIKAKKLVAAQKAAAQTKRLADQQKQVEKAAKQETTKKLGLDLDEFYPITSSTLKKLKPYIGKFIRDVTGKNEKSLKADFPNGGWLPAEYQSKLLKFLQEVYGNSNPRNKRDIEKSKEIKQWLEVDKVALIFKN